MSSLKYFFATINEIKSDKKTKYALNAGKTYTASTFK
jgi:hypothetical protein